ncbi:MAG: HEAT repeat domain-containing protein [Planctomycetales bacterium]|nr:HEAT repeat domain-containing protein [Planctomycetales bacterium]
MKRINPYFVSQWQKDRDLGPTYEDRIAELELLSSQIASMPAARQEEWAQNLQYLVSNDPSASLRAQAARVAGKISSDTATRVLNRASSDESMLVRMAACEAWKLRPDQAAQDMLLSMALTDEDSSVRQAAIESLSAFDNPGVLSTLEKLLDDSSPAIQFQTVQTLRQMTGRDYAGDFDSWKKFLAGEDVPEPSVSVTAAFWNALPKLY